MLLNSGFVLTLPVHARPSVRWFILDLSFLDYAANVSEGAHCGSDDILPRAIAARLMLHSRCFSCSIAALEAVIHLACSILLAVTPIVLSGLTRAKQSKPHQSKTSFLPATLCLSAWHSNRPRAAPISSGTMRCALALCCPTENWA